MQEDDNRTKTPMDPRCPRKLDSHPETWCELAVLRLKALRQAGRELSEEEESRCPGCPYSINHQMSNYCFFKYAAEYLDTPPSDMEIAHMNSISVDTVKKIEKEALCKVKESRMIKDIEDNYDEGESVIDWTDDDDQEHHILY